MSDGSKTLVKLTPAQQRALAKIRETGVLYDGNGVSFATIGVLYRAGLVEVTATQHTWTNYRSRRTHHQRTWTATPKGSEVAR